MVGLRVGLGFLVACVTGLVVQRQYRKYGNALLTPVAAPRAPTPAASLPVVNDAATSANGEQPEPKKTVHAAARQHLRDGPARLRGHHRVPDPRGGAGRARQAVHRRRTRSTRSRSEQPVLAIPAMMVLAVLMCLCSEADAFVAASFTKMHVSAKLAFLVLGPMLDLKLLLMYTRVFRPRLIVTIVVCVVVQVLVPVSGRSPRLSGERLDGAAGSADAERHALACGGLDMAHDHHHHGESAPRLLHRATAHDPRVRADRVRRRSRCTAPTGSSTSSPRSSTCRC